jgi:hypothetical protein
MDFYNELFDELDKKKYSKEKYSKLKLKLCKKHNLKRIPSDIEISLNADSMTRKKHSNLLSIKPAREMSGVNVIAIMTKPIKCPHGKCDTCPGGTVHREEEWIFLVFRQDIVRQQGPVDPDLDPVPELFGRYPCLRQGPPGPREQDQDRGKCLFCSHHILVLYWFALSISTRGGWANPCQCISAFPAVRLPSNTSRRYFRV